MIESAINSQEDVVIISDVEEDGKDEKNITNKTEIPDVCEKESNDSKIEQEKIDEIEDDQPKSEASNPLGNATEEPFRDMDKDSSQEESIEIKETEVDDPQEEGENSYVFVKESNDSEIEPEKIDEIEDDQPKCKASNPLGNATEETNGDMEEDSFQDKDEDSSQEEIIEIRETEIDGPQEEGTESIKSNEIEDDKPRSYESKFIDDNRVDEESEKEAG